MITQLSDGVKKQKPSSDFPSELSRRENVPRAA